ncbi:unnamed protein product [Cochlearia groenlandica]
MQTLEVSPLPPTADPPLPAGSPPADVAPPPPPTPAVASSKGLHASTDAAPITRVKRVREEASELSSDLPRVTRCRTEVASVAGRDIIDEEGAQVAELGPEEAGRSASDADVSQADEEGVKSPLVEEQGDRATQFGPEEAVQAAADVDSAQKDGDGSAGADGFGFSLDEGNEHGFCFSYDGLVPFLNHKEASGGFQRAVYSAFHGEKAPSDLVLSAEVAELARLEQRVAYKRTRLNFSYEKLLAEEKSSAQARLVAVEEERDAATTKVQELEAGLASLSYEASDFELPADLGLDSLIDFMVEESDERADDVQVGSGRADDEVTEERTAEDGVAEDEARQEGAGDEVARDANSPEE